MALSPAFVSFIGTLSSTAKNILKTTLQSIATQIKVIITSLDVKAVPIKAKILVYTQYVNLLRATYQTTKQTFTPVMSILQGKSQSTGSLQTNVTNRIPEFGVINDSLNTFTLPIYRKLEAAEGKLRAMNLEKEQISANQTRLQSQYDSIQEQIAIL